MTDDGYWCEHCQDAPPSSLDGRVVPRDEGDPMLILILLIASLICLTLAAFGGDGRRIHLGWLGLALFVLTVLVPKL